MSIFGNPFGAFPTFQDHPREAVTASGIDFKRIRRNRIAEAIHVSCLYADFSTDPEWAAQRAVMLTDALNAELDK
jgi:hypothetical protein